MVDVSYLVKGYVTELDKEKRTLYVGQSPKKAFGYLDNWGEKTEITLEIWEDGQLVRQIEGKREQVEVSNK
jgi:hypothetical protein